MKLRGSELVVRALEDAGARFAFGIPGTHNIELYDALDRSEAVTAVLITDEQSAGFMADGVSRSSASVGVVNVVPGAGVTHCLSGVAEALLDGIPLVVLACGIRSDTGRAYQLHDIDQAALLRPVTKAVLRPATPDDIYDTVRQAFDLAVAGTPGPVAVEIPADFYMLTHEVGVPARAPAAEDSAVPEIPPAGIERAARLVNDARRVLLYVGHGARGAGSALVELAERLGAPVATTVQGKGVFPEHHPLWVWNGMGATVPGPLRDVPGACDVMLAIGVRFSEVGTGSYGVTRPPTVIHVDINPDVFNRNVPATLAIAMDAAAFVKAILPLVDDRGQWGEAAEQIANGHRLVRNVWLREPSEARVTPAAFFATLQRLAPDAIYTTDSGNGTFLAMEHLRLDAPGCFLAPVDFSCMGYSVPAAIGAKLANPDRDVIALAGDGAFLMTGLELLTASSCGAAPVVCLLRDGELAQIAQFQRTAMGNAANSVLPSYDAESFARTVGAGYVSCARDASLESARPSGSAGPIGRCRVTCPGLRCRRRTDRSRGCTPTGTSRSRQSRCRSSCTGRARRATCVEKRCR
ncbi:MAG: thiamine pyrophosphate-binding protein [Acidobacteria bacterium]|nr:thiamine pyrophosphate-binding protein [Acidobacteriota bacterium]